VIRVTNFLPMFLVTAHRTPFALSSELIHRNAGLAVRGDCAQACLKAAVRWINGERTTAVDGGTHDSCPADLSIDG
jgi:hypothetical protein